MDPQPNHTLVTEYSAALDWWRGAGVDYLFEDEASDWLAAPEPVAETPAPEPAPVMAARAAPEAPALPALDPAAIPASLDRFISWWMAEPLLDDGRTGGRVMPRGTVGAKVMVVVPEPERDDREILLDGPQGKLLTGMTLAMGYAPDDIYIASALTRHTPMADWNAATTRGMGLALARHVALVAPQRLIVLGNTILPLLGHDPTNSAETLRRFNQESLTIPLFVARGLAELLQRPAARARFWQEWLDWTE